NLEVIEDLCKLASDDRLGSSHSKFVDLARKRAGLYQKKIQELKNPESKENPEREYENEWEENGYLNEASEGTEEQVSPSAEMETWQAFAKQAQAYLIAAVNPRKGTKSNFDQQVKRLKDPYLEAQAYQLKAKKLRQDDPNSSQPREMMKKAIERLPKIDREGRRVGLGMEILENILEEDYWTSLRPALPKALGNDFAE